ncbi:MAG: 50S ribosomal protein L5, partial [Betaproteobacteria bacterium]|nr:50S ribosomal protein L5 [Betaproteobacteria bacterium]
MARLQQYYRDTVVKQLTEQFGYRSVMQVPRIEKIVLNMGVGDAIQDAKLLDGAAAELAQIAGQKP